MKNSSPPLLRQAALVLVLCLALFPGATARATAQQPDFTAIDAYITGQMKAIGLPGLALGIVHGDQIVYLQGYAMAASGVVAVIWLIRTVLAYFALRTTTAQRAGVSESLTT